MMNQVKQQIMTQMKAEVMKVMMFENLKDVDDGEMTPDVQQKIAKRVGMIIAWKDEMEKQQSKMKAVMAMKKALEHKVKSFVDDLLMKDLEMPKDGKKGGGGKKGDDKGGDDKGGDDKS